MTPLAHRIVKELTLPKTKRTIIDDHDILRRMDDVHCFEVSGVKGIINILYKDIQKRAIKTGKSADDIKFCLDERSSFLPAPKTWIEECDLSSPWGVSRGGMLLVDCGEYADCTSCMTFHEGSDRAAFGTWNRFRLPLKGANLGDPQILNRGDEIDDPELVTPMANRIYAQLAIINTPRIIGRKQHMPHRGLERKLTKALGIQGKFPLHAWTEIKLHVTPPRDMSEDGSHEAHLTGKKALHFCRAHLRIRLGRLEVVRAHWRGDASLGIKQSRYKVVA